MLDNGANADVNKANNDGDTPLHDVVGSSRKLEAMTQIISLLIANGADALKANKNDKLPLRVITEKRGVHEVALQFVFHIDTYLSSFESPIDVVHQMCKGTGDFKSTLSTLLEDTLWANDRHFFMKWLNLRGNFTKAIRNCPLEAKELNSYVDLLDEVLAELFESDSFDTMKK